MKQKMLIYGAGTYGKIVYHDIRQFSDDIEVVAFVEDKEYIKTTQVFGIPLIAFETVQDSYPPPYTMLVCCGYSVMRNRKIMYTKAKAKGYTLPNYISNKAILETMPAMGDNNIILANSVVGYNGIMGSDNIIFQNVWLGHDFVIGDHSIIAFGSNIGGRAKIGSLVYISIGVSSTGKISFGDESLVGVGSCVVRDVEAYSTVVGNPAKVIRYQRETGVIIDK